MNQVILSADDIERLLTWRDEHKDEVRSYPAPLQEIEIICEANGLHIKAFRRDEHLKMYLTLDGERLGRCKFLWQPNGMWKAKVSTLSSDQTQSCLTVYCSLMALMAHGRNPNGVQEDTVVAPTSKRPQTAQKGAVRGSTPRVTYILRHDGNSLRVARSGSHASPKGVFTVRGHYRHYKSGKVVWVEEFKKGTGKKKSRTYKLGSGE